MWKIGPVGLLIIEVFAGFALSREIAARQLFKLPIERFGLARAFVGVALIGHHALNIGIAPGFFDLVGKFVVSHCVDNQVTLDEIPDVLEDADILLNFKVGKFPGFPAVAAGDERIAVVGDFEYRQPALQICPRPVLPAALAPNQLRQSAVTALGCRLGWRSAS